MTICATVAPNMTNMRRSILLSEKANATIATNTTHATIAAPHNEISDTNIILIFSFINYLITLFTKKRYKGTAF